MGVIISGRADTWWMGMKAGTLRFQKLKWDTALAGTDGIAFWMSWLPVGSDFCLYLDHKLR